MKLSTFMPLIVMMVGVAAILLIVKRRSASGDQPWPYAVRKPMSVPEQVLYFRLLEAMPEHIVLAQVQLSRFLGVKRGQPVQGWLNRINRLSVDFLILEKDASIVAAIELDDRTHQRSDRREADSRKNRALAAAGVKLVRWNVANMPSAPSIRAELQSWEPPRPASGPGDRIEPVLGPSLAQATRNAGASASRQATR